VEAAFSFGPVHLTTVKAVEMRRYDDGVEAGERQSDGENYIEICMMPSGLLGGD
jgi:hypothetical protein